MPHHCLYSIYIFTFTEYLVVSNCSWNVHYTRVKSFGATLQDTQNYCKVSLSLATMYHIKDFMITTIYNVSMDAVGHCSGCDLTHIQCRPIYYYAQIYGQTLSLSIAQLVEQHTYNLVNLVRVHVERKLV